MALKTRFFGNLLLVQDFPSEFYRPSRFKLNLGPTQLSEATTRDETIDIIAENWDKFPNFRGPTVDTLIFTRWIDLHILSQLVEFYFDIFRECKACLVSVIQK